MKLPSLPRRRPALRVEHALLAFVLVAHAAHLPWWAAPLLLATALLGAPALWFGQGRLGARLLRTAWLLAAALGAGTLAWWAAGRRADGTALLVWLCIALVLKRFETRDLLRDRLFNIYSALLVGALLPAFHETATGVPLTAALAFLGLWALAEANGLPPARGARTAGALMAAGLPAAALLFLLFPRVPGPLTDIGLAMGLPLRFEQQREQGGMGADDSFSARPRPGGGGGRDPTVLIAEFKNTVPPPSSLYWRGPVLWRYDGQTWKQQLDGDNRSVLFRDGPRSAQRLAETLSVKGRRIDYTVRLLPHGARWLYALDLPASTIPESFVSRDLQLLSVRLVRDELHFAASAWQDYRSDEPLAPELSELGLQWPDGAEPRTRALGEALRRQARSPAEAADAVLLHFAQTGYLITPATAFVTGPDAVDRILFDLRAAHPDQMAGAFVLLMRAAGVPARLVTGYRGGRLMALTNFVTVKQSNGHAWPEAFIAGRGWVRFEPVDVGGTARAAPAAVARPAPLPGAAVAPTAAAPVDAPLAAAADTPTVAAAQWFDGAAVAWLLAPLRWIVRFDPARQIALLGGLGLASGNWLTLLMMAVAAVSACALLAWIALRLLARERIDPLAAVYRRFLARCRTIGIERAAQECPSAFAARVAGLRPDLAEPVARFSAAYLAGRYGRAAPSVAQLRALERSIPL